MPAGISITVPTGAAFSTKPGTRCLGGGGTRQPPAWLAQQGTEAQRQRSRCHGDDVRTGGVYVHERRRVTSQAERHTGFSAR